MSKFSRFFSLLQRPRQRREQSSILDFASIIIARLCFAILVAGVAIVLIFLNTLSGKATILEWMLACLLFGIFIGFLFGIPKILQGGNQNGVSTTAPAPQPAQTAQSVTPSAPAGTSPFTYQQQVNTNLTEISDWLTKIIVGLGLVNLKNSPHYLRIIAKIPADALTLKGENGDLAFAFAYGTIVTYTILGFLFGYIITRIFLAALFLDADRRSLAIESLNSGLIEAKAAASSANNKADLALASATSGQQNLVPNIDAPPYADQQISTLIHEYNDTRQNMLSGGPRTAVMTNIFSQMIRVAASLPAFDVAAALSDNTNDGRRLAAYAWLFAKPDINLFDSLIDALVADPIPFNQYSAIQALKQFQARQPNKVPTFSQFAKLKSFYDHLENAEDRKYELEKLFPSLKPSK